MHWLAGDEWPAVYGSGPGATGYDPDDVGDAAVWVLHAVYERLDMPPGMTHHELHHQAIAAGLREPLIVGDVDLDDVTITTGQTLGFQERPPAGWSRVSWRAVGDRDGFEFWAIDGRWPKLHYTPRSQWTDPDVIPADAGPRLGLTADDSWPVSILPPPQGSLDEESLLALIDVLGASTDPEALRDCAAYYGPVAYMGEGATVYAGELTGLPALVTSHQGAALTPNNVWPADQSWLVYTDYDLEATRVRGPSSLIDALCADDRLDIVRCGRK